VKRGELALSIIRQHSAIKNARVLDLGCGTGGTAFVFARAGSTVAAVDIRLDFQHRHPSITFYRTRAEQLSFSDQSFDIIIMQDVWEHVPDLEKALSEVCRVIAPNGCLYISTPNRWSMLNAISDPHWHIPLVSTLPRREVEWVIKNFLKRDTRDRVDWAELSSLRKITTRLKRSGFRIDFHNRDVARTMFTQPEKVVCKKGHISFIKKCNSWKFGSLLTRFVNDKHGIFNTVINPTWYMVATKNES
jgi:SAM-dependent methyltransferase